MQDYSKLHTEDNMVEKELGMFWVEETADT